MPSPALRFAPDLLLAAQGVRVAFFDVDGVLTDGGLFMDEDGEPLKRTLGMHFLGGATLDSEENYLIKKFFTAAGAVSIENQARI